MVDGIVSERWGRLVRALTTREWGRRVSLGLPAHVAPAEGVDLMTLVALMEERGQPRNDAEHSASLREYGR